MTARRAARLWSELARRKVTRVAAGYAIVAWAVIEVAATVFPHLGLQPLAVTLVIVLLLLGLPVALVLAWAYDVTPAGISRTPALETGDWDAVQQIVGRALELEPNRRRRFIERACGARPGLRTEIESLVAAAGQTGVLDRPVPLLEPAPTVDAVPAGLARAAPQYEILEKVGGGGMGVVYRARDRRLGRVVALKFLPPHLSSDASAKERFLLEAKAAAALDHPNICTIYDAGETQDGHLFLAMPFYEGESLKQRLDRGPLGVTDSIAIATQVADGLDRAHARGIVHRDIKPANLVITAENVVKIVDFGVAKLADVAVTVPGLAVGTAAYMSPEQARGEEVDGRTDVWSLGVVLYEMLTGERPFRAGHERLLLDAISTAEPAPIATHRPEVPAACEDIVTRALAKRVPDRFTTAREMADALRAVDAAHAAGAVGSPADRRSYRTAANTGDATLQSGETTAGGLGVDAERRMATVVATALGGFDVLVERLVPDALAELVQRVSTAAAAVAQEHGAVLNEFSGEQLVLLFGVPTALEDDAVRATRAALDLHGRLRPLLSQGTAGATLTLHTGVDTGSVIAHPAETAERAFRLAGATPQIALRLAQQAEADEVLLSADCRAHVSPFFDTEASGSIRVRGRSEPLATYRVLGATGLSTRIEAAARAGLTTFTGRDGELATLQDCLAAARSGEGRLVAITGEPGMGKSRLLHEFRQHLGPGDVPVLVGRCQSYGGGVAYLPFIDMLRTGLNLGGDAQDVQAAVRSILEISPTLEEFTPLYLNLLSIRSTAHPVPRHLQGDGFRLAMQEALAALITLYARDRTTVVILEDWHWADDASRAVLQQVAEVLEGTRLLLLVTSRPGYGVEWEAGSQFTSVPLRPLEPAATVSMLRALLGTGVVDEELVALVHERTGGNPFFIEEVVHTLQDQGAIAVRDGAAGLAGPRELLQLPDSIQGVIRARLDRLERREREVLRLAAVIGREFSRTLLERTMTEQVALPAALDTLKAAGLVQQTRLAPDAAYRFKHVLTQEVAYASLLEHQRRDLHGRVGAVMAQLYDGRSDDEPERLAYHFSRAEIWDRAVEYGLQSAGRANRLAQFQEALQILERTQRWIAKLPVGAERDRTLVEILLQQERLCETLGHRQRQQQIIDQLISILEHSTDASSLAEVYVRQGDVFTLLRRFDEAEAALQRSLELRRRLGDRVGERNTLRSLGLLRWHEGRNQEALLVAEETLRIDTERGDLAGIVGDMTNCGAILRALGENERARDMLEQALAVSESRDGSGSDAAGDELAMKRSYALHHLANLYREGGNRERAYECLQRAGEIAEQNRLPIQRAYNYTSVAHMYLRDGRVEDSLQLYREGIELTRRARYAVGLAQLLRIYGEVLIGLDRREEALPHLHEAAGIFTELRDADGEARMLAAIAESEEHLQRHGAALAAWSRAAQLYRQLGDGTGELKATEGVARATRSHLGEPVLALAQYERVVTLARSVGDAETEGRALNAMGILEWMRGEHALALTHYERGLELFRRLDDDVHAGLMLNSVAAALKALGRTEDAVAALRQGLELHRRTGAQQLEAHALALLGDLHIARDEADDAFACYDASLQIRRSSGDRRGEGWMLHGLARCELVRGVPYRVREHAAAAAAIAEESGDHELAAACEQLRRVAD